MQNPTKFPPVIGGDSAPKSTPAAHAAGVSVSGNTGPIAPVSAVKAANAKKAQTAQPVVTGSLVHPKPYDATQHAVFRVVGITRNGWVRCTVAHFANGERPRFFTGALAKFRITQVEVHAEKGGAS